jgi:hypothetical protein
LAQHKIAAAKDLAVHVNLGDEAKAMRVGIKEKSVALRQKLGKLFAIANPELGDQFLAQVIIILSFMFK